MVSSEEVVLHDQYLPIPVPSFLLLWAMSFLGATFPLPRTSVGGTSFTGKKFKFKILCSCNSIFLVWVHLSSTKFIEVPHPLLMLIHPSSLATPTTTDEFKSFIIVAKSIHMDRTEASVGTWMQGHDNSIGWDSSSNTTTSMFIHGYFHEGKHNPGNVSGSSFLSLLISKLKYWRTFISWSYFFYWHVLKIKPT